MDRNATAQKLHAALEALKPDWEHVGDEMYDELVANFADIEWRFRNIDIWIRNAAAWLADLIIAGELADASAPH